MKKRIIFLVILFLIVISKNTIHAVELKDIDIHGFISQGFLKTNKNNYLAQTEEGTFQFNEMGINFSTDLTDQLHIGMQFFARDLGTVSNDNVVLDWAFADYRWQNWMGFRIGKVKIDYGLYNESREMDMLRTSVMLPQSVYPELWRNSFSTIKGLAVYGYVPLSFMGKVAYDAQIGAMEYKQDTGYIGSFGSRFLDYYNITDMDADYAWVLSLKWNTPLPSLKAKITYYDIEGQKARGDVFYPMQWNSEWDTNTVDPNIVHYPVDLNFNKRDGYVLSLEYTWENLAVVAEYVRDNFPINVMHPPPGPPPQLSPEGEPLSGPPKKSEGWYISGSYRFTDWFELGLSYSEYYPNADNKHGTGIWGPKFMAWLKTTTLSTRFDINDYWVLKLESSYNDGFGGVTMAENRNGLDRYWYLLAAKVTFSF